MFSDSGPLNVVVIGDTLKLTDPDKGRPTPVSQAILAATAQGLVSYDGNGQIEPGLAQRWLVTDDGLSYIFRIRDAQWSNGEKVTTANVAALMRAHIEGKSRNRYAPEITGIETIRPMTAEVVEMRLSRPLPHLLDILAQPDMALLRGSMTWGPMTAKREGDGMTFAPKVEPVEEGDIDELPDESASVHLIVRNAAKALARYRNDAAEVVLGGRFQDYPLVAASEIDDNRIIVDPAEGLFGLAFTHNDGILKSAEVRQAISMAIRRQVITQSFTEPSWTPLVSLRPPLDKQDPAYFPALPAFAALDQTARTANARAAIASATASMPRKPVLRIALPDGLGSDLLFASIKADLKSVGLESVKVKYASQADLRLLDEVAPSRDPFWYLRRLSCLHGNVCNSQADARLAEATRADDPLTRAALFREAETMMLDTAGYIPLAEPMRWSVTSPRSTGLRSNPRARHPLNRLVALPN